MRLKLNGIDVDCIIGERPDERNRLQRLIIDVDLEVESNAVETDELSDTIDYAVLTDRIRSAVFDARCKMIERVAKLVHELCMAENQVISARVRVVKRGAIAHLESAEVEYDGR